MYNIIIFLLIIGLSSVECLRGQYSGQHYFYYILMISTVIKMILFADDTNLFYSGNDLLNVCNTMSSELGKLNKWFQVNKLSLNIQKTNFMIFGNKKESQKDYIIHNNSNTFNIKSSGLGEI